MILIPDAMPAADCRPDSAEASCGRSVELGLRRMDFRYALARQAQPDAGRRRPRPWQHEDAMAPEWEAL